ncbi:MAG: NAD-dependent epimerase/dehydratase family protein [Bacteroidetes bacterium]|nr:NAD-dependent epimerase/dehydratase family protein [Bacteroidota bacterium]
MYLITGASGLVGSQFVFDLISMGRSVRILLRKSSSTVLIKKKFKSSPELFDKIQIAYGDVLDIFSIEDALQDCTHVFHCAAMVSFNPQKRKEMYKVNADGTANVVNACLEKRNIKLGFVSSVATLGRGTQQMINENDWFNQNEKNSYYAISKYAAEREVWRGITEGLNAVIINPSVILGDGNWRSDSSSLFNTLYSGLKFYTQGVSGFVDVKDVSRSLISLTESEISGERFIISSENKSYEWLFKTMAKGLNIKPPTIKAGVFLSQLAWRLEWLKSVFTGKPSLITNETAYTSQQIYNYDNSKITEQLNYRFIPVEETVDRVCKIFIAQKQ